MAMLEKHVVFGVWSLRSKSPKNPIQNLQKMGKGVSRNLTGSFSVRNHPFHYEKLSVCCFGSIMTKNRLS